MWINKPKIVIRTIQDSCELFDPHDLMVFVQARRFSERWDELGLTDTELQELERLLMLDPRRGSVVRSTGGLRKLRFSAAPLKKGKRGGLRICYVFFSEFSLIHLLLVYPKNEQDDLTYVARKQISSLIKEIHRQLASRPRIADS